MDQVKAACPDALLFLGGDFNLSGIDWDQNKYKPGAPKRKMCETLLQIADDFHLEQVNLNPTRRQNVLELLFTSCPALVTSCSTGPGISDHDHIVVARCKLSPTITKKKPRTIQLFKKADWSAIKNHLKAASHDFSVMTRTSDDSQASWESFKKTINDAIKRYVPTKRVSARYKTPWVTRDIRRLIRKKKRAYNKAKASQKESDWLVFRNLRKLTQKTLKEAHANYLNDLFEQDSNKGLWRYLKSTKQNSCGVSTLVSNGKVCTTGQEKADVLNEQFSSVFTHATNPIPSLGPSVYPSMPPITIAAPGVHKLLCQLDTKKASGSDGIPAIVLKTCADEISPMLATIIQQTLNSRNVPTDWKEAIITPVFKKGDRTTPANYRPVSLTSICCKIAEHIIVSATMKTHDDNNILVDNQHGFRRKRSCETQLIITTDDIATILNNRSQADIAILDFAKAFDKVPHRRLLEKLRHYNLDENVCGWIESFLKDRTQRVVVDGFNSSCAPVLSGVPQGTVLGPLLFLIFINDITADIDSTIRLFADDCLVYRDIKSKSDCQALQNDLDRLVAWSHTWGMEFNVSKCNVMTVTLKNKKNRIDHTYKMSGENLKRSNSEKYLGVTLNNKLEWGEHIDNVCGTTSRLLGFLRRAMHRCPPHLKEKAYKSLIRPRLEYCCSVWDPHHKKYHDKLEMVQRRAARFVTNNPRKRSSLQPSVSAMVDNLGWEPLTERRRRSRIIMMYKTVRGIVDIPKCYLPPVQQREGGRGHSEQYLQVQPVLDAYKYAFIPRTVIDWNALPSDVVAEKTLDGFKRRLSSNQQ